MRTGAIYTAGVLLGRVTQSLSSILPSVMRNPLPFLGSFPVVFLALSGGRAEFKPSVFDTSPWLPMGEVTRNLWQPLLERLNQGRQSKSLVKDALVVGEGQHVGDDQLFGEDQLVGEDHQRRDFSSEPVADVLSAQGILRNSTQFENSGSTSFHASHKSLKRRKKSERYGARLSEEELNRSQQPVHRVFPNDPKYPSDHDFKEDPIFVVLNSSQLSSGSHLEARFTRSPFKDGAEQLNSNR